MPQGSDDQTNQKAQELLQILEEQKSVSQERMEVERNIHELRKEIYEESPDHLSRTKKLKNLREGELDVLRTARQHHEAVLEDLEERLAKSKELYNNKEQKLEEIKEKEDALSQQIAKIQEQEADQVEQAQEKKDKLNEKRDELQKVLDKKEEIKDLSEDDIENLEEALKLREELLDDHEEEIAARQRAHGLAENQAETLFGISEAWKESTTGAILYDAKMGQLEESAEAWGRRMKELMDPMNVMGSMLEKVEEATIAWTFSLEQSSSEFAQATGVAKEWDETIDQAATQTFTYGVSVEEVRQSMQTLYDEFALFNQLQQDARSDMAQHVAYMEKLGVRSSTTAQNLDFLTKGLGQTKGEAQATQRNMLALGQALGKGSDIIAELNNAMPKLAQHGDRTTEVFKNLAKHSAETGIATGELIDTVSQFDTFEGAAEAAGRLNAMLGQDLVNSVDMMRKTEAERVKTLRDVVDRSGQAWEAMNRYRKMSIANAAGIQDMAKANRLFGSNSEEAIENLEKQRKSQKALAEEARRATPVWQRFQAAAMQFAVSLERLGVIDLVEALANKFLDLAAWVNDLNPHVRYLAGGIALVVGASIAFSGIAVKVVGLLSSIAQIAPSAATGMTGMAEAGGSASDDVAQLGQSAQRSAGGILAMGAAIAMAAGGIWLAAHGIGTMAEKISTLKEKHLQAFGNSLVTVTALMLGLVAALVAVGMSSSFAAVPVLGLSLAILGVGAAIALAAAGMTEFTQALTELLNTAPPSRLLAFAAAMWSITVVAWSMIGAIPALFAASYALSSLTGSLEEIPLEKTKALAGLMQTLGGEGAASRLQRVASAIGSLNPQLAKLVSHIKELPSQKAVAFQASMKSMGSAMESSAQVTGENVKSVERILKASKEYHKIITKQNAQDAKMDALMKAVTKVLDAKGGGASKKGGPMPEKLDIRLTLDGRELDRKVINILGEQLDQRTEPLS